MPTLRHILISPAGPGLYRLASRAPAASIAERALEQGWQPFVLDGAAVLGKADFLAAIAAALAFPAYFGHNWDALADSLTDLSWLAAAWAVWGRRGSRSQKSEVRSQKSDVRNQTSEIRNQKSEACVRFSWIVTT